jgi:uroporphyrinogen decarboxylase
MNSRFLKACRGEPTDKIPVWFMRQAGRSLPGYRALRKKYGVLELAQTPELAAQVSLEPIELLSVDAAILFADIMLLPLAMGVELEIVDSVGPVIKKPIRDTRDVSVFAQKPLDVCNIAYLQETIQILRGKLVGDLAVPLIGFSGAPFTLASYLIEGKPTRTWVTTKRFMLEQPAAWHELMTALSQAIVAYLSAQIDAGAQVVQLFDSWVGCLSPADYREHVLPHVQWIFSALATVGKKVEQIPRIHFGTDTGAMLEDFSNVDCEVIGLDWRIDIARAQAIINSSGKNSSKNSAKNISRKNGNTKSDSGAEIPKAIQGNLDPVALLADEKILYAKVDALIGSLPSRNGFIFNLGHGILPETDDKKVRRLVEYIHGK